MKVLIFVVLALAAVNAERDWSNIRYREIDPFTRLPMPHGQSRIVGGEEAVKNSIPFQAALFVTVPEGTYFCGGSLISKRHVLTAAHCLDFDQINQLEVILGAHAIRENESTQQRFIADTFKIHLGWISLLLVNDIAIITLPQEAVLNEYVQIAELPTEADVGNDFAGDDARVSGWGKDSDEATAISPVLRFVNAPIFTNDQCNEYYLGMIREKHICMDGDNGKSSCSGDSGGPLVLGGTNKQIGIVSFGVSLGCSIGFPSAYTRVTSYLDWIETNSQIDN